jgi:hypothetical protein
MSRAEYHRAYYWQNVQSRRATARRLRAQGRLVSSLIRVLSEAVDEARTERPRPFWA